MSLKLHVFRHRPRAPLSTSLNQPNITCGITLDTSCLSTKPQRLYSGGTAESLLRLTKPFRCPSAPSVITVSNRPKRRRASGIDYRVDDNETQNRKGQKRSASDPDDSYEGDDKVNRASLRLEGTKFPVFRVKKDGDTTIRSKFSIPLIGSKDGSTQTWKQNRAAPLLGMRRGRVIIARPLHDPCGEYAIVLFDPTVDDKKSLEREPLNGPLTDTIDAPGPTSSNSSGKSSSVIHKSLAEILGIKNEKVEVPKVPVVIDPRLAKVLRPHQVEGVRFLYRCTTGLIDESACGCIMADEMGLGKTLQCITLLWTLLKQSPMAGVPTIAKCVITCPSSLVKNWANELIKWLGKDTLNPFAVDGKLSKEELCSQLRQWASATGRAVVRPVLIVSYETLRLYADELKGTPIGLMLCDEGHRLKNDESLTFTALNSLNVQRRVILSGTPIQNDLSEYFALLNFANPNYLGSRSDFHKKYEIPILRGRDSTASSKDRQLGDAALSELLTLANKFIIRRTNDILSKYLPVKYEHVVFCSLSPLQRDLYTHFLKSPDISSLLRGKASQPLKAIGILKKLCNHPELLDLPADLPGCEDFLPEDFTPKENRGRERLVKTWYSGKFTVLDRMLARIRHETDDKIVLISNYTQTLDLFEKLCRARGYGFLRLDGSMGVNKRQKLVDRFNQSDVNKVGSGGEFVFLLSSKAGGCGLNLIGANRLVLFDPDWNPAADQQALARVWRDGQTKDCFVYRFIATGTIEEKIFQRQSHKQSLSSCVVDEANDVERHFSRDDLRELFKYLPNTNCDTHDTFDCRRCTPEGRQRIRAQALLYGDSSTWNHFVNDNSETGPLANIHDELLRTEVHERDVSAVFEYISH